MALSIASNVPSLAAQNALSNTSASLNTSLQRLSTGLKINSGSDGPAAYVISQQQQAQLAGLQTAIQNTSKATDLVQVAGGALGTISNLLTQIRGLALDAANSGVQDPTSLAANQAQIQNALQTINKIAANTQFGNQHLLDGSAGVSATSSNAAAFTGLKPTGAAASGVYTVSTDGSSDVGAAKGDVFVTPGTTAATQSYVAVDASTTAYLASGGLLGGNETLTITGPSGVAQAIALTAGEANANVILQINAYTPLTGVVASNGGTAGGMELQSKNGADFTVKSNVAAGAGSTGIGTGTIDTASTASSGDVTVAAGVAGNVFLTSTGTNTTLFETETLTVTGANGNAAISLAGGSTLQQVVDTINGFTPQTGVVASINTTTHALELQSLTYGTNFTVVSNLAADSGTTGIGNIDPDTTVPAAGGAGLTTVTTGSNLGEQNAQKGALSVTVGTSGANTAFVSNSTSLAAATTLTISGPSGGATINLAQGLTNTQVAQAINNYTSQTGVVADTGANGGGLRLYTQQFGQNFHVSESNLGSSYGNGSLGVGSTTVNTGAGNDSVANPYNANFVVTTGQNAVVSLTDGNGSVLLLTGQGATLTATTGTAKGLTFALKPSVANPFVTTSVSSSSITVENSALTFQIGANAGQTVSLAIGNVSASSLGVVSGNQFANLSDIDVTTTAGAQAAIAAVDQAINDVSTESGTLGAFQTDSLQAMATNLQTTLTNAVSSESTIADTDFASEIANFTKMQVQMQAGTSVLGIANQSAQTVATLLQKL